MGAVFIPSNSFQGACLSIIYFSINKIPLYSRASARCPLAFDRSTAHLRICIYELVVKLL